LRQSRPDAAHPRLVALSRPGNTRQSYKFPDQGAERASRRDGWPSRWLRPAAVDLDPSLRVMAGLDPAICFRKHGSVW